MPKFKVRLTAVVTDITEAFVVVEARDAEAAKAIAVNEAELNDDLDWQFHECVTGHQDIEADSVQEA
ncbi:MAG: hypothetical protein ACR2PR_08855 [Pseudohongiellaceae bacterium]